MEEQNWPSVLRSRGIRFSFVAFVPFAVHLSYRYSQTRSIASNCSVSTGLEM
jgi:hypothetical protein